jgi:peroxiredoxin Q/BCP
MSFDSVEANAAFAKKFNFPYTLLCDVDKKVGIAYGAAVDVKNKSARRISYLINPEGKIKHVWDRVDTKTHFADVLEQIP